MPYSTCHALKAWTTATPVRQTSVLRVATGEPRPQASAGGIQEKPYTGAPRNQYRYLAKRQSHSLEIVWHTSRGPCLKSQAGGEAI